MEHKELQKKVNNLFVEAFVHTPLTKRLEDIFGECRELCNYTDLKNLKEETGDLLASLIQLCNESGWDVEELLKSNEEKIRKRMTQYKAMGRKTQVAILGGAFNPVTKGHIELAQFVLKTSRWADEVWLCPSYGHMDNKKMEPANHRLEMLKLASEHDGRIKVFDYEIKHELGGETYHFLNKLIHDPDYENYRFAFIVGIDRANTISSWYNSNELLKMDVPFIVTPRSGYKRDESVNWYLNYPHIYIQDEGNFPVMNVSSTRVRDLIGFRGDVVNKYGLDELVGTKVTNYIVENELYFCNKI
jgi:nicotinate-nucleotide adenylyltransferase